MDARFLPSGISRHRPGTIRIDTKRIYLGTEPLPDDDRVDIEVDKVARALRFIPAHEDYGWKLVAFGSGATKIVMPGSLLSQKLLPYGIYKRTAEYTYTHQSYIKGRRKTDGK